VTNIRADKAVRAPGRAKRVRADFAPLAAADLGLVDFIERAFRQERKVTRAPGEDVTAKRIKTAR